MVTIAMILGLLNTIFLKQASAQLEVIGINFIKTDPYYIDYNRSSMSVDLVSQTISIELLILKEFPKNSWFDVELIEQGRGDLMNHIVDYSTPLCENDDEIREPLPTYVKQITMMEHCGVVGKVIFQNAGLYKFDISEKILHISNPIINSNEITCSDLTILKYDVILKNADIYYKTDDNNTSDSSSLQFNPKRKRN